MHDPAMTGQRQGGQQQRGKSSGSRKCNCCPYGYHLDLDFVRYCEKVANSQLLQSTRNTIPRIRAGRKKRESIESLLGIPSFTTETKINIDTGRNNYEENSNKAFSDALEKAVSDFEKMFKSSSKPKSSDEHDSESVSGNINFKLNHEGLGVVKKAEDPFEDSRMHINGTNNASAVILQEIRHQMAESLSKMRQLEEEVKHIPNLQNQIKKLRWENRRLTKLLETKTEAIEKNLRDQRKANGGNEDGIRHRRTIGTSCTVLQRDVAVSNQVSLTTTGTNPFPPDIRLLVHQHTNTDSTNIDIPGVTPRGSKLLHDSGTQTISRTIKPIVVHFGVQTDNWPIKVPSVDVGFQHDSLPKVIPTSTIGCQIERKEPKVSIIDVGIQLDKAATTCVSTQSESRPDLIPTCKDACTQVVQKTTPTNKKDIGSQIKTQMSDASVFTKLLISDSATQTSKCCKKDIGINVNVTKLRTSTGVNTDAEKKIEKPHKPLLISKLTDTQDLYRRLDACVEASINLAHASVDTRGLKDYVKKGNSEIKDSDENKKITKVTLHKENSLKTHTLQSTKNNEVSNTEELQENISSAISIISKPYEKREPSKEMKGAMKVLNDSLLKSPSGEMPKSMRNAINIIQQEWFKVSSTTDANPLDVEDYLDCFEETSVGLLEYIVNMTDVSGNTAMHYAVSNGNFDVVSILLDSKVCNINKLNTAGYTCIMLVALTKVKSETDRQVVRRLFHMADVNIRAKQHGQTALMLAVSHGRIDTVELLLESGADINIQDEDGSTALMCAAEHGYIDIVKLLLAQPDCDLSITDLDGNTALNIAMEAGNRDIGVLLYAQEHFSRGNSPFSTLKSRRAKSSTPTLKTRTPTPPNCSQEHSL